MKLTLASASQTFEVIAAVLAMAAATFPEQLVHLGGDETTQPLLAATMISKKGATIGIIVGLNKGGDLGISAFTGAATHSSRRRL